MSEGPANQAFLRQHQIATDLERLTRYAGIIRLEAIIALPITIGNLAVAALGWVPSESAVFLASADALIQLLLGSIALAVLLHLDFLVRRGEIVYDEIADELHWCVTLASRKKKDKLADALLDENAADEKDAAGKARAALRDFARAARLPLITGSRGAAVYAAVNVVATFIGLIGMRLVP